MAPPEETPVKKVEISVIIVQIPTTISPSVVNILNMVQVDEKQLQGSSFVGECDKGFFC